MSATPAEPTTTPASTEPPAAAATPPVPTPPADPPKASTPEPATNPWEDPKAAQAEIERLRKENGAARTNAKAQAAEDARKELAQTIGKALGLVTDEPVDPAELTKQLTQTQAQAKQAALELAVFRSSADAATANALLDSRTFLATVADLDPNDTSAISAAVNEAVEKNPALGKRQPAPNPAQGSSGSGPSAVAQLTEADLKFMTSEQIVEAQREGRLTALGYGVKKT